MKAFEDWWEEFTSKDMECPLYGYTDGFKDGCRLAFLSGQKTGMLAAAEIAEKSCLVPPDGGSPNEQEVESARYAAELIRKAAEEE